MKLFGWFTRKSHNQNCKTDELSNFIQQFVTEESLEPAVAKFISQDGCRCGCRDVDMELDMDYMPLEAPQPVAARTWHDKPLAAVPELEVLLAGHKAWCAQIEQVMRENKTSEYNMANVGSSLMCCIGKWLYYEGKYLRHYPEYQQLVQSYEKFHECAETMLANHKQGYFMEAVGILRGEFVSTSTAVQESLQALLHCIRHKPTAQNDETMRQVV